MLILKGRVKYRYVLDIKKLPVLSIKYMLNLKFLEYAEKNGLRI